MWRFLVRTLLQRLGLPVTLECSAESLTGYMRVDKKARAGAPRFALLQRIGTVALSGDEWTHAVPESALEAALQMVSGGTDIV